MDYVNVTLDNLESIQDYLGSFDLFAGNEAEGIGYLNLSLRRILITLGLIPPAPESGGRLLELGANPYFLTLLLKRFNRYELTLANYFGKDGPAAGHGTQVVASQRYGERHKFPYDHFNGEEVQFPYPDSTFDMVLNCEILEHLILDPTHLLCECHRVLKPGGFLLLTTPNILAFQNLWRLGTGQNVYDLYSGYGVYGRHNREYTPSEVIDLLQGCGFSVNQVILQDIYPHFGLTRQLKRFRKHWRDNIFVLAQVSGRPIYSYPEWLYRSMSGLRRIVRSDIVMGENDQVQLGEGWYPLESLPCAARWTQDKAMAYLLSVQDAHQLGLEVNAQATRLGPITLRVEAASVSKQFSLSADGWHELHMDLPSDLPHKLKVCLSVESVRNPARLGISQDDRELGVLVRRLWIQ